MNDRKEWIDNLRGFAIILVIIGHVIGGLVRFDGENNLLRTILYQFHTPLLFMISGYVTKEYCVITSKTKDYICFFKKQVIALYFPYLFWGTCFWSVKYFIYQGNEPTTLKDILRLPFDFAAWVPGWFLLALLGIRLLDRVFQELEINIYLQGIFWIIVGGTISFYNMNNIIGCCMEYGFYFYIGRLLRVYLDNTRRIVFFSVALIGLGTFIFAQRNYGNSRIFLALGISLLLFVIFESTRINVRMLKTIGEYSIVPYVLHAYFTIPFRGILEYLECDILVVYIVIETIMALLFSVLVIIVIKKRKIFMMLFFPNIIRVKKNRK